MIGIDISDNEIKLISLLKKEGGFFVQSCIKHAFIDIEMIQKNIKHMINKTQNHPQKIAIAISDTFVITKEFLLSSTLNEDEIEKFLMKEAEKSLRLSEKEIYLDFAILSKNKDQSSVFFAASSKNHIDSLTATLKKAGLKITIIDIFSLALQRVFLTILDAKNMLTHTTAISHFTNNHLLFIVLENSEILYKSTISYPENQHLKALERAIKLFYASHPINTITNNYLSGDAITLPDHKKHLLTVLQMTDLCPVFENIGEIHDFQQQDFSSFLLSLGLAMRAYDKY